MNDNFDIILSCNASYRKSIDGKKSQCHITKRTINSSTKLRAFHVNDELSVLSRILSFMIFSLKKNVIKMTPQSFDLMYRVMFTVQERTVHSTAGERECWIDWTCEWENERDKLDSNAEINQHALSKSNYINEIFGKFCTCCAKWLLLLQPCILHWISINRLDRSSVSMCAHCTLCTVHRTLYSLGWYRYISILLSRVLIWLDMKCTNICKFFSYSSKHTQTLALHLVFALQGILLAYR